MRSEDALSDMSHIILTRFNVPTPGREAEIRARTGWLERRFDIFAQYCLPAVAAQTARDFIWIIYFDTATPKPFRERIERCQQEFPFVALFRDSLPPETVIADVRAHMAPDAKRLLTTRLDNDDALARDFVARLQVVARDVPPGTALNFPDGVAWRDGWVFSARDESNPFASVVEDARDFRTIWCKPHTLLAEAFTLRQIEDGLAWVQVIHGENVTNRVKGRQRPGSVLGDRFAIRPGADVKSPGALDALAETLMRYPYRVMRETAVRMIKPFVKAIR